MLTTFLSVFLVYIPVSLAADPVVSTSSGQVRGQYLADFNANQFLGIPYATQKRFQPPESYLSWTGIRNATSFGASCPQTKGKSVQGIEDCLFLNVYTPSSATASSGLAVMFWIHGGGFKSGAGDSYTGKVYAKEQDIIFVSINYRLGVLGFFNYPGTDAKGNNGMLDQIMALKWVKDNIKNFGGDPKKVTVFGESSGSACVSMLGISTMSAGLFKQTIMQSGSAVGTWSFEYPSEETTKKFAETLGCSEDSKTDTINCIKKKSVGDILTAQSGFSSTSLTLPTIDQSFLTDTPRALLESGKYHHISVMMGSNINEGNFFLNIFGRTQNLDAGMSNSLFETFVKNYLKKEKKSVQEASMFEYSDYECLEAECPLTNRQNAADVIGDCQYVAPMDFEMSVRSQGDHVYSFLYNYQGSTIQPNQASWIGTTHASEIEYVFGYPMMYTANFTNNDKSVSATMMKSWANFAKTGDPNHNGLGVTWPKFVTNGSEGKSYLSFQLQSKVEQLRRPHKIAFWNSYVNDLKNEKEEQCTTTSAAGPSVLCSFNLSMFMCVFTSALFVVKS